MNINKEKLVFNYKKDTTLKGSTANSKANSTARTARIAWIVLILLVLIILIIIILNKFKK